MFDNAEAGNRQWLTWTPSTRTLGRSGQSATQLDVEIQSVRLYDDAVGGSVAPASGVTLDDVDARIITLVAPFALRSDGGDSDLIIPNPRPSAVSAITPRMYQITSYTNDLDSTLDNIIGRWVHSPGGDLFYAPVSVPSPSINNSWNTVDGYGFGGLRADRLGNAWPGRLRNVMIELEHDGHVTFSGASHPALRNPNIRYNSAVEGSASIRIRFGELELIVNLADLVWSAYAGVVRAAAVDQSYTGAYVGFPSNVAGVRAFVAAAQVPASRDARLLRTIDISVDARS